MGSIPVSSSHAKMLHPDDGLLVRKKGMAGASSAHGMPLRRRQWVQPISWLEPDLLLHPPLISKAAAWRDRPVASPPAAVRPPPCSGAAETCSRPVASSPAAESEPTPLAPPTLLLSGLLLLVALSLPRGESDSIATGQRELTDARGECLCVISIAAGL